MNGSTDAPVLVVVTGLQGTGKSALASAIARELGAAVIAWDWVMAALTPFERVQEAFRAMDGFEYADVGWALLLQVARLQLTNGTSAVLDGLARDEQVARVRGLGDELGVRSFVVLTACTDLAVQRARIEGRARAIPGWHELRWDDVLRTRERWVAPKDVDLVVDERGSIADHVGAALAGLRA